jgi:hypothetical protein
MVRGWRIREKRTVMWIRTDSMTIGRRGRKEDKKEQDHKDDEENSLLMPTS